MGIESTCFDWKLPSRDKSIIVVRAQLVHLPLQDGEICLHRCRIGENGDQTTTKLTQHLNRVDMILFDLINIVTLWPE
jgi:hypothetical protein